MQKINLINLVATLILSQKIANPAYFEYIYNLNIRNIYARNLVKYVGAVLSSLRTGINFDFLRL